jgi:hypothetical protein
MNPHPLRMTLAHLRTELDRIPPLEATDPVLAEVRYVTTVLLAQTTTAPTVAPHPSFRKQLGTAMNRFEMLHPTVAAAITQVVDTLNRMGI